MAGKNKKKTIRARKTAKVSRSREAAGMKLPVHIRSNGDVDNEVVNVRKLLKDEVVWHSDLDDFTVHFPISPFNDQTFHVPSGGSVSSGPVRPDAPLDFYEYNISGITLAKSADPGVAIKK